MCFTKFLKIMKTKIFYIVRGETFRSRENHSDIVEIFKVFKNDNPIIAREKAFEHYQTYIDLFLLSKNRFYINHELAIKRLQDFFNSYNEQNSNILGQKISSDTNMGISVYYSTYPKPIHKTTEGIEYFKDEKIIHNINKKIQDFDMQEICFCNLLNEAKIYKANKYPVNNNLVRYDVAALYEQPCYKHILNTPINFIDLFIFNSFRTCKSNRKSK